MTTDLDALTTCDDCHKKMNGPAVQGCTFNRMKIGGTDYTRMPYQHSRVGRGVDAEPPRCRYCFAAVGQTHHYGCSAEECPVCHEALIECDCEKADAPHQAPGAQSAEDIQRNAVDLYDLGEFLSTVQQAISSETGEFNGRTAPLSLLEIRQWADRLYARLAANTPDI